MARNGYVVVGLLLVTATLARAQDEALAKAAVNRARESLQAFDGADLERLVDVDAKRARFIRDYDDALAEVDLLPAGPARDIGGHSLNRIVIDALFARGLSTQGLNRRVELLSLDEALARLDRTVLGRDADAVAFAVRRVHRSAVEQEPGCYRVGPDYIAWLGADLDATTQALRALVPAQKRYAQLLGTRLSAAVRLWRRKELLVESPSDRNWTKIGGIGTVVDKAWLDARTPPFITQRSQLIDSEGGRWPGVGLGWRVYTRRNTVYGSRVEVELIASDGTLVTRLQGKESEVLKLPTPARKDPEGWIVLATVTDPDGTVHTTADRIGSRWFDPPADRTTAASTPEPEAGPSVGLTGALQR